MRKSILNEIFHQESLQLEIDHTLYTATKQTLIKYTEFSKF